MALSQPRRIFTRRKRFPWAVSAVTLFAAAEISYVVYSWDGRSAPGCDAEAVQTKVSRLVERATRKDRSGAVEVAGVQEVDRRVSGGTTVMRACVAEAAIADTRSRILFEVRPDNHTSDYQVVLSGM